MTDSPNLFIAMQEIAHGNESIGTEWISTCSFSPATTLADIWEWRQQVTKMGSSAGRLMITLETRPEVQK